MVIVTAAVLSFFASARRLQIGDAVAVIAVTSVAANLAAILRPSGQLAAQCGGAGNIESIQAALRELGEGFEGRKHFATADETRTRLERAGFTDIETWLHDEPTELDPQDLEPYLATICLGDNVEGMADDERERFVAEVARRLPGPRIDYVRLNIRARRAV